MLNRLTTPTCLRGGCWTATAVTACALLACAAPQPPKEETYGAMVGVVNHTDRYVYSASVNGASGGHMSEFGAGGGSICCVSVPVKWRPGLKAHVEWDMPVGSQHTYQEKTVEIEPYGPDDSGHSLYIHLFPNGDVRVVVARYPGYSKGHPIAPPVKLLDWKRKEGA